VVLALRLREPVRGGHERRIAGADEVTAAQEDVPERVWATMQVLGRIPTFRRIWMAVPFLGIALFAVPNLLSLLYEDVFGLNSAARGAIAAGVEPLQVLGVIVAMPYVSRVAATRSRFLLGFVAVVGVVDALLLVVLAYAPNVATAVAVHAVLAATIGTLAPAFFAMLSLVAPPRVRAAAFSTMSVFAIPGIVVFLPLIGVAADRFGIQVSMTLMVPVALAAGFILASAGRTIERDIEQVRSESLARIAIPSPTTTT
jgi:MFS family permease